MSGKHRSLMRRVFMTVFGLTMGFVCVFALAGTAFVHTRLVDLAHDELAEQADMAASALDASSDDMAVLGNLDIATTRLTLVGPDGAVLYDTFEDAGSMGNHAGRPEIRAALEHGQGTSERSSSTLGEVMVYEAKRLDDGSVVRLAQEQAGYLPILVSLVGPMLLLLGVCALLSLAIARRESRRIIAPLTEVDLDHPTRTAEGAYAEMVPMLERIESQRQELKRQMRAISDSDRMRREFTANITHELKTPLTTVSGYAELIANDLVTDEADLRDFGSRIYREAGRLTSLVNDILTLSNLDEAERSESGDASALLGSREPIDLRRALESVKQRLEQVADRADVAFATACEPALVVGVPRLVDELVYNLASNAIRYNRPGGSVTLACGVNDEGAPYIRVSDTGIGIAPEEVDKIFERFYRVEKSRSKAGGGTGLGLAIVKHAAHFHDATIDVKSEPGCGTDMTVTFPTPRPDTPGLSDISRA